MSRRGIQRGQTCIVSERRFTGELAHLFDTVADTFTFGGSFEVVIVEPAPANWGCISNPASIIARRACGFCQPASPTRLTVALRPRSVKAFESNASSQPSSRTRSWTRCSDHVPPIRVSTATSATRTSERSFAVQYTKLAAFLVVNTEIKRDSRLVRPYHERVVDFA